MNYSKSMKVNIKRFIIAWIISLILIALIASSLTILVVNAENDEKNFTEEIQETKLINLINMENETPELKFEREPPQKVSLGEYTITAYCSCEKCCGIWAKNRPDGIVYGASGIELESNLSIAAPGFEFGTSIYIDGLEYVVHDRTANWIVDKYESKIIDIYFDNHQEALNFGKQVKEVFIIKGE